MALMSCPDCGCNVSDTAEVCIHCGCDLYLYREELRIDQEIEHKLIEYTEESKSKKPPEQIRSLSEVPLYRNEESACMIVLVAAICFFAASAIFLMEAALFSIFLAILGIVILLMYFYLISESKKRLKEEQDRIQHIIDNFDQIKERDIELYKQALLRDKQKKLEKAKNRNVQYTSERPKGLRCPACDSSSFERITTLNRAVSVELVGIASGKIGKQYKCKKCGHMW